MKRPVPRVLPFVILLAVAVAVGVDDWLEPSQVGYQLVVLGPAILGMTIAAVAAHAYRVRRDPALLFGSLAALTIGATSAIFFLGQAITVYRAPVPGQDQYVGRLVAAGSIWFAIGWLAACVALMLATPWRDRRGRRPIRAWIVTLLFAGPVAIGMIAAYATWPTTSQETLIVATLAALTVVVGLVACIRALRSHGNTYLLRWMAPAAVASALSSAASAAFAASRTVGWAQDAFGDFTFGLQVQLTILTMTGLAFILTGTFATERMQASRMRRASDRAAEVMEGRAEIAATIAHDVRGPVGTIKGLASTTRKSYERLGDPERLEFIGMIEQESGRLMRLVDQVAMALRIDAGTLEMTRRRQPVRPLIDQAVRAVEVGDRTIEVGGDRDIEAAVDTRWFIEAIAQGVDNALRFSPDVTLVTVTAHADMGVVVVDIVDRGPGIPVEQRPQLFAKFVRWRPTGYEDRTGTGLGLFIARGILETHGGSAELIDGPGGGTMLRLRVPSEEERIA